MKVYSRYEKVKNYLDIRLKIEMYSFIPVLLYILYITYFIHNSKGYVFNKRKVNKSILSLKLRLTAIMSIYFIYLAIFLLFMGDYLDDNDKFLGLLVVFLKFGSAVMTPFVIHEKSNKEFPFIFSKIILIYWLIMSFVILYELILEIEHEVFFHLLTLSLPGLICSAFLSWLFFKYPRDDLLPHANRLLAELQLLNMISETTINQNKNTKFNENISFKTINKNNLSQPFINNRNMKRKSDSNLTADIGMYLKNDICLDDLNHKQPEKLPHYSKIEIIIKNDFKYQKNKTDMNDSHPLSQSHFNKNEENFEYTDMVKFISNFYLQIMVKIKDKKINHTIKRNIKDFFLLDQSIKTVFDPEKYKRKLINRLPRLKIPIRNYSNDLDFFKNYKINFEMYLKNILNEPSFITNEVLEFLNIYDDHLAFSYDLARKNYEIAEIYRIKDDIQAMSRKKSSEAEISEDESIIRESISRLKQDFSLSHYSSKGSKEYSRLGVGHQAYTTVSNNYISPKTNRVLSNQTQLKLKNKLSVLEISQDSVGDYTVSIRYSHLYMFKIVKRNLSEVIKIVYELNQLNKNNENVKQLIKLYNSLSSENKVNFTCFHSGSFLTLLENVIQNLFDNMNLYKSNHLINDFFSDFVESNLVSERESFLVENQKEDSTISQCKMWIEKYDLIRVSASVPNYLVLSHNFKPSYFFIVQVELELGNGRKEKIVRKYKYSELKQYFDFLKIKMNINLNTNFNSLYEKMTYSNEDDKIQKRIAEINKCLNLIFSNPNLLNFPEWTELFNRDKKYKKIISHQNGNEKNIPKPPPLFFRRRTESKESLFNINIRESIL